MSENTTVLTSDIERLIGTMGGVTASKVVSDDEGRIVEIHVLSDRSRSPKQLVRDIQSCTMAAFGVPVDYKTISVAQVDRDLKPETVAPAPAPIRALTRLRCGDLSIRLDRSTVEVVTTLEYDERRFEGRGSGPATPRGRLYAAAAACLDAIHTYLGSDGIFLLLEVQRLRIAGIDAVEAALSFVEGDHETILLGSAVIRPNTGEESAVVRAVLDAMNRILFRTDKDGTSSIA